MDVVKKNIPNALSLMRIVMIVPFVFALIYEQMFSVFLIVLTILVTDYLDGYLARAWNATSDLGKILDPMADKICIAAAGIILIFLRDFPFLLAAAFILRDLIIVLAGLVLIRNNYKIPVSNNIGRVSVCVFSACMIAYLFDLNFLKAPTVLLSVVMLVISLISYGRMFFATIRTRQT